MAAQVRNNLAREAVIRQCTISVYGDLRDVNLHCTGVCPGGSAGGGPQPCVGQRSGPKTSQRMPAGAAPFSISRVRTARMKGSGRGAATGRGSSQLDRPAPGESLQLM
ncbi:hypothetical protein Scel_65240 [Streptomyces cellostaticus]|nr:hypothetical protein Scel_65240 [Streptomyces cellostaticus]